MICHHSHLFLNLNPVSNIDFIISNPPYIPSDQIDDLQVEIAEFEPRIALDGGHDGLDFYRYLLEKAPGLLKSDGKMILELGDFQESNLIAILKKYKIWGSYNLIPDLQGKNRVWELNKLN